MTCPHVDACPMFALFTSEECLGRWRRLYCESARHERCDRFVKFAEGGDVPATHLPNGHTLQPIDPSFRSTPERPGTPFVTLSPGEVSALCEEAETVTFAGE